MKDLTDLTDLDYKDLFRDAVNMMAHIARAAGFDPADPTVEPPAIMARVENLRAEVERLTAELEEARLTLATEQGRPLGAPSAGWRAAGGDWSKGRARVKRSGFLWRWHVYAPQPNDHKATIASGCAPTARAAMLAADAAHPSTPAPAPE